MPYDTVSSIWQGPPNGFFRTRSITVLRQSGPHCVSTCLAMLTNQPPKVFQGTMNTQDPVSWSDAIKPWDLQLAYCASDTRRLRHLLPELIAIDDLFMVSYYTPADETRILAEPDANGWICGSHVVLLHRSAIYDPASGSAIAASAHHGNQCFAKRIFRVVPVGYPRSL